MRTVFRHLVGIILLVQMGLAGPRSLAEKSRDHAYKERRAALTKLLTTTLPLNSGESGWLPTYLSYLQHYYQHEPLIDTIRALPAGRQFERAVEQMAKQLGEDSQIPHFLAKENAFVFFSISHLMVRLIKTARFDLADNVYESWKMWLVKNDFLRETPENIRAYELWLEGIYAEAFLTAGPWQPGEIDRVNQFFAGKAEPGDVDKAFEAFLAYNYEGRSSDARAPKISIVQKLISGTFGLVGAGVGFLFGVGAGGQVISYIPYSYEYGRPICFLGILMVSCGVGLATGVKVGEETFSKRWWTFVPASASRSSFLGRSQALRQCELILGGSRK
ncbi:MAG: hypothetical protein AB7F86_18535 [Bdellovibrionales bacterium]